jgi:hypothetical protein
VCPWEIGQCLSIIVRTDYEVFCVGQEMAGPFAAAEAPAMNQAEEDDWWEEF